MPFVVIVLVTLAIVSLMAWGIERRFGRRPEWPEIVLVGLVTVMVLMGIYITFQDTLAPALPEITKPGQ